MSVTTLSGYNSAPQIVNPGNTLVVTGTLVTTWWGQTIYVGGSLDNQGLIRSDAAYTAAAFEGQGAIITNSGTIINDGTGYATFAIETNGYGSFDNSGVVIGDVFMQLDSSGTYSSQIVNTGYIHGIVAEDNYSVADINVPGSYASDTGTIINFGTILASDGDFGVVIAGTGNQATLGGLISGSNGRAVAVTGGTNELTLLHGVTIDGQIIFGAGSSSHVTLSGNVGGAADTVTLYGGMASSSGPFIASDAGIAISIDDSAPWVLNVLGPVLPGITGFGAADTLVLQGASVTAAAEVSGVGILLESSSGPAFLSLPNTYGSAAAFYVHAASSGTTITVVPAAFGNGNVPQLPVYQSGTVLMGSSGSTGYLLQNGGAGGTALTVNSGQGVGIAPGAALIGGTGGTGGAGLRPPTIASYDYPPPPPNTVFIPGGAGGNGGAGLYLNGGVVLNAGTIAGGNGGAPGYLAVQTQASGGAGVILQSGILIDAGTISGGNGAAAVSFTGTGTLEVEPGAVFNGGIAGLTAGDILILESFAATTESFVSGRGLILSNATASETLGITGSFSTADFTLTASGGNTTIAMSAGTTVSGLVSTISTYVYNEVALGQGSYATTLSITNTGTVVGIGGASPSIAVLAGQSGDLVINSGLLHGGGSLAFVPSYEAVHLTNATLVNYGTLIGGSSNGWGADGVRGSGTIINSGVIIGGSAGTSGSSGVAVSYSSIVNSGTILAGGTLNSGGNGINLHHGTLQNSGLIQGWSGSKGANINGVYLANTGTIISGAGGAGVYLNTSTLVNDGTIIGLTTGASFGTAVQFGNSVSTLVIGAGAVLDGAIAGLQSGDVLIADGFAATAESFVSGTGLILSNATASETLDITGSFSTADFALTSGGGNTTIALGTAASGPVSTISTYLYKEVSLGQGGYATTLSITNTGTVIGIGGTAPSIAVLAGQSGDLVINSGLLHGGGGLAFFPSYEAVHLTDATLVNDGTLIGGASNGIGADGVRGNGTIINSGIIIGGSGGISGSAGISVSYSSIVNTGTVLAGGTLNSGANGINLNNGTLQNAGLIKGWSGADGVKISNGYLSNTGTIISGAGGAGVYLNSSTLVDAGTIIGATTGASFGTAVQFGNSVSTLVIGAGAVLDGAIAGLQRGDVLIADGFAATSESFVSGTGLILSNATASETLDITGSFSTADFALTSGGGNTTIAVGTTASGLVSTISTYVHQEVALGQGSYAAILSITNTGTVAGIGGASPSIAVLAGQSGDIVINSGLIAGGGSHIYVPSYEAVHLTNATLLNYGTLIGGSSNGWGADGVRGSGSIINAGIIIGGSAGTSGSAGISVSYSSIVNSGTILAGGTLNSGGNGINLNHGTLQNSGLIQGWSGSNGANITTVYLANTGTIISGANGAGVYLNNSTLFNDGTIIGTTSGASFGTAVQFGYNPSTLVIGAGAVFDGAIAGLQSNDLVIVESFAATAESFVSGTGLVLSNATASETIDITGSFSTADFAIQTQAGNTLIDLTVPCFCTGTRIATARGNVPVESLKIGDMVKTATQGFQPIRWIGRRAYDGRFIAGNHLALPVTIRRHALGHNVPARDLHVSPGHAICEGGVLVHSWRLVNGVSITQAEAVERVEYFHIELDRHTVIFAQNTPVESFLDNGCRAQFHNADGAAGQAGQKPCLPLIEDGYYLARLKARIDARAGITRPAAPGRLRGNLDHAGLLLCGWAQDEAAPETPVELDLLCGSVPVMRFLANKFRTDLRAAGLGSGCHAFELTMPPLTGLLTLRRVSDGAILGAADARRDRRSA